MSGLLLSLKPNEKFLVNGALLANGPKRGQICIVGDDVNVLRLSDVIHPDTVKTPVTRLYAAIQSLLSGDTGTEEDMSAVVERYDALAHVFDNTPLAVTLSESKSAWDDGRLYSALCRLKPLIPIEAELLGLVPPAESSQLQVEAAE